jgi:hypothetical protein
MVSTNAEHQFYVIQIEFISAEKKQVSLSLKKRYFPAPITIVRLDNGRKN